MVTCSHTDDFDLIRSVLTDDYVWNGVTEDGIDRGSFTIPQELTFCELKDEDELLGICGLRSCAQTCVELHTALLKAAAGRSQECFIALEIYLLQNTLVERLITRVPETNPKALKAALKLGFEEVGILKESYLKGGSLVNQYILQVNL